MGVVGVILAFLKVECRKFRCVRRSSFYHHPLKRLSAPEGARREGLLFSRRNRCSPYEFWYYNSYRIDTGCRFWGCRG